MKNLIQKSKKISTKLPLIRIKSLKSNSHNFGDIKNHKIGIGEEFWDYRDYVPGDSLKKIDWKKSSKFSKLFIKNNENQNSKNIWFWINNSVSMNYRFSKKTERKIERAQIIGLILIDIFLRSGEKVGIIGSDLGLQNGKNKLISLASNFVESSFHLFDSRIKKGDIVFIISDFIENPKNLREKLLNLSENFYSAILIQVLDPSELNFPFKGRNRFFDPVSGLHKLFNRSENMKNIFRKKILLHQKKIKYMCDKFGWKVFTNQTNETYESLILKIYNYL